MKKKAKKKKKRNKKVNRKRKITAKKKNSKHLCFYPNLLYYRSFL